MRIKDSITQWENRSGSEAPVFREQKWRGSSVPERQMHSAPSNEKSSVDIKALGKKAVEAAEKEFIQKTLQITRWNRRKAAEMMRISYKALLYKIKEYGLKRGKDI